MKNEKMKCTPFNRWFFI